MPDIDPAIMERIEKTREQYDFLTFLIMKSGEVKVGIVQNSTPKLIMVFDYEKIKSESLKRTFLDYGDEWWWKSSQSIPVDSFIGSRFDKFGDTLVGYPRKSIETIIGPTLCLADQYLKRVKKKRVEFINKKVLPKS